MSWRRCACITGHRSAFSRLQKQAGLRAIKGLDLAFFINRYDALLSETPLPTPDLSAPSINSTGHLQHWQFIAGEKHNFCALHIFMRTVAITADLFKTFNIGSVQKEDDSPDPDDRLEYFEAFVNFISASMH